MLKSMIVMPTTVVLLLVCCLASIVVSGNGERENGGLFREYKEDLNEYLTSEEVDRLVYGNDESVISEKIKNMPDMSMSPPGHSGHQLPVPTMDPSLDSIVHGPIVKKLPPQRNNFMNMMKTAARMLTNRNVPSRSARQRVPLPQFRARPSTLTSSQPDQLEVAFKRIEIIAARAGLNMSSMPRRTQMQVVRKLAGKLPPRMSQLMKTTLDHNSQKLYDYLPEPSRDPLVEDSQDFLSQFMEGAKVSMDGAEYSIMPDHHTTFEYSEPTHTISTVGDFSFSGHEPGEIITHHTVSDPSHHHESGDVMITDHQPGTDYSIPSYDSHSSSNVNSASGSGIVSPSTSPFGFSAPPPSYESHPAGFGIQSASPSSSSGSSVNSPSSNTVDLKPIAAPLIGETHEIYAQASENLPTIISPNSYKNSGPIRSNKALKVTSIKNVTPSAITTVTSSSSSSSSSQPVIRVSMPTKDEIKINKPIRVSIITKDNVTNISPYVVDSQPIFTQDEDKEVKAEVKEIVKSSGEEKETTTSASTHVNLPKTEATEGILKATTPENTITFNPLVSVHSDESPIPHKFIPMPEDTKTTVNVNVNTNAKPSNPPPGLLLKEVEDDYGLDSLGLGLGLNDDEDQDLTSSELIAELKKYNSDYANSLEIDYPLAPHPLEYPDHPDHPDNSDPVPSTATATTAASPRPTAPQHGHPQRPHGVRPHIQPHGGPRLPIRPRIRPPPGPGHFGRPGPNGRPMPPRRPPHGHHRPGGFRPPLRINEVTVSEIPKTTQKECDYFSEDLCLAVQDYPIEAISEAMATKEANQLMVKEPAEASWVDGVGKNQEGGYNFKHYYGDGKNNDKISSGAAAPGEVGSHRHRDFAGEGGFLCPSKVAYGRVKKARSFTTGEWKYVVNYGENSQTLRLEKCLSPGNSCSYVMPHYRTSCSQVYNYNRLLAWDSEKGLHMDIFKVPTCCTCHVQGYYIPGQQQGITPARRRDIPPKLQYAHQQHRHRQQQAAQQQKQQQHQQQLRREQQLSQQQAQASKQAQSKFNDELQELLGQYSSLREKIAKKKNERQSLSYSVSYSNSTKENSKRESSKSLRNSEELAHKLVAGGLKQKVPMQQRLRQRAMLFNIMKRMKKGNSTITKKKLTQLLKAAHLTAKPVKNVDPSKSSHFNGTAHKLKTSRAITLHKLANILTALSSPNRSNGTVNGTNPISKARVAALTRSARRLLGQRSLQAGEPTGKNEQAEVRLLKQKQQQLLRLLQSRQGRFSSHETKLDKLKLLLNRSLLKNRRSGSGKPVLGPLNNKRLQLLHQLQMHARRKNAQVNRTKQRLRLGSKKPSKVNYSYHPIMDYFGSKPA